ncbi:hypothetical protein BH10PAT3_BH10PAT3_7060 [soil metagenome]
MRYTSISKMKHIKTRKITKKTTRKRPDNLKNKVRKTLRFLPATLLFAAAFGVHSMPVAGVAAGRTNSRVLSYATSMNNSDLLSQTNSQRSSNGVASLNLNAQLNSAAQAKANDMVSRNYWSHNTPDGEEPWAFMARAGYQYKTAGENLAYGFDNGADTVTGWMNSPPHRQNLLNSSFLDVGFGFANSANYVNNGEQTIIVAMYGAQLSQPAAVAPAQTQQSSPPSQVQTNQTQAAASQPAPSSEPIQTTVEPVATQPENAPDNATKPVASVQESASSAAASKTQVAGAVQVRRIQLLTGGSAHWSSTFLVFSLAAAGLIWVLQRGYQLRRMVSAGEHFLFHHIHRDLTVLSFISLGYALLQTT